MKTYNAKKAINDGSTPQQDKPEKPEVKKIQPSPAKKASEAPNQAHAAKKRDDSLSSFTSDDEVKPGK